MKYTADAIEDWVTAESERLFAPWAVGRPENWTCDRRTKNIVCISYWLVEELTSMGLDHRDRVTQQAQFNRYSRLDDDLWALAAQIMNDSAEGNIDRDRKTHRRWG